VTEQASMNPVRPPNSAAASPDFAALRETCGARGPEAMLEALAASLAVRRRWHALFDLRMVQARQRLGLPVTGDVGPLDEATRERFDELSLAACREVGWPLLEEGQVAAAWMYLRATATPDELAARLAPLAERIASTVTDGGPACTEADPGADDDETQRLVQELVGVSLWESADPALGIALVLRTQGTCNAVTAYEQAVSRLPATRQAPAARVLVEHLHAEVVRNLVADRRPRWPPKRRWWRCSTRPAGSSMTRACTSMSRICRACCGSRGSAVTSPRSVAPGNFPATPAGCRTT